MSVFKRLGSPYYVYDFLFRSRRCRGSTKLTNKIAAQRSRTICARGWQSSEPGSLDPEPPPLFKVFADQFVERTKNQMRPNTSRCYSVSVKSSRASVRCAWMKSPRTASKSSSNSGWSKGVRPQPSIAISHVCVEYFCSPSSKTCLPRLRLSRTRSSSLWKFAVSVF